MKNYLSLTWAILIILLIAGCKERRGDTDRGEDAETAVTAEMVQEELHILQDSIDKAWAVMIEDDDQKLAYIERLIKELEYTGRVNPQAKENVSHMVERLKKLRYDRRSMAHSDSIDMYDFATDTVIRSTTALVTSTPTTDKYPLVDELLMEIHDKDARVINYRIRYDAWAMEYNRLLDEHRELLQKSEIPDPMLEKKPLFQLP